jgi:hypothetical protein
VTRPASPFAPPPSKRRSAQKRDTASEAAEKAYVRQRDRGCVADRARSKTWTPNRTWLSGGTCSGRLEVDHVRASGALSKKSVTHRSNMVLLCSWHHKLKTEYGRTWRPLLLAYLERVEVGE